MAISLLKIWTGPLPKEELYPTNRTPNPILHWLLHPLKRHISRLYLKLLQRFFGLKVIAIGGSNGKTTTRNLLFSLLSPSHPTIATKDSITSTYNIPSSILRLRPWTKYFICEMSVEYIGDMDFYLWLAKPDIAIVTLIDTEHTKYFGSLENVALEENKLTKGKWIKIINGNSPQINTNALNTFTFGLSDKFTSHIKSISYTPDLQLHIHIHQSDQNYEITLPTIGKHLAHPLAGSLLCLSKLNLNPQKYLHNLNSFQTPPHRLTLTQTSSGISVIDDSYNSNPSSAKESLNTAKEVSNLSRQELIVVISQMNELGPYEISEHQKLANHINSLNIKHVYSIGEAAKHIGINFNSYEELLKQLKKLKLNEKHIILIKSSRSWKLERLVSEL